MEGVTHAGYRDLVASYGGVGVVCTEFVRITRAAVNRRMLEQEVVRTAHAALSVQVMGDDEANMALATEWVVLGGTDIVDINLGCPAPNAVRKGVGAAMLERPEVLARVVGAMRERTQGPLSAKMRAGVDATDRAVLTARLLEAAGVDFITVHPRRSIDSYRGRADHRIVKAIKQNVGIPVVGNGDLWYASDAVALMRESGCDAVMLGRPALRNPFIFAQIAALHAGEPVFRPDGSALLAHVHAYVAATRARLRSGSNVVLAGLLKEQLRYLLAALADGERVTRELVRQSDVEAILSRLESRLSGVSAADLDLGPEPAGSGSAAQRADRSILLAPVPAPEGTSAAPTAVSFEAACAHGVSALPAVTHEPCAASEG